MENVSHILICITYAVFRCVLFWIIRVSCSNSTRVLHFLEQQGIDINGVRGQSYSNASNMSGRYKGMQARIHYINPKAVYIPCATHSFNLVRICALLTVVLRQSIFME